MLNLRRLKWACAASLTIAAVWGVSASAPQPSDKDRPKISMRANPMVSRAPSRVVLTVELTGGANDYEDYYCPTVEWNWGDGTESESTTDCEPYQPGKSEIKRRFTVEHVFKAGNHRVTFRLKRHDRPLTAASVQIQVQPGIRDIGEGTR
jgi:hypothetical protein